MKKRFVALLVALTIAASGAAGFGGACLANVLAAPAAKTAPLRSAGVSLGEDIAILTAAAGAPSGAGSSSPGAGSSGSSGSKKALTIPEIASKASGSVVEIYTESVTRGIFLRQYVVEGSGSGVIVSSDGRIVTCAHLIDGARKITVRLTNGTEYQAALVGKDSKNDLAVVKIEANGLKAATYGDSDKLVAGELAVVIGNPLGRLGGSVTEGIISALGRNIEMGGQSMTLLQTSAAVNPGNSGGGLFNRYGELVGVVSAKSSGVDVEGIGFAIPSNKVKSVAGTLTQ
ncbi:MAG: trypsin-like peptidase domain-containing protein [Oscillospiraceae bacterium]|jgi:serine protease Do|nr:trypsin-like peptidase domain-containing protein [Oscillospiraceae bacterium]